MVLISRTCVTFIGRKSKIYAYCLNCLFARAQQFSTAETNTASRIIPNKSRNCAIKFHSSLVANQQPSLSSKATKLNFLGTTLLGAVIGIGGYSGYKYWRIKAAGLDYKTIKSVDCAEVKADGVSLRKTQNFIADIVEQVAPAVVFIEVHSHIESPFGIMEGKSNGSGFLVSEDGLILTNHHVIHSALRRSSHGTVSLSVKMQNGTSYAAEIVDSLPDADLACLKINANKLPFVKLANSKEARPGELVIALGSPLSLDNTVTSGVISNVHRNLSDYGLQSPMGYIQTDATICQGSSGGPLINLDGEVVGVNNMTVAMASGISFAIPSDYARAFLESIEKRRQQSKSKGGWFSGGAAKVRDQPRTLGITMLALDPSLIEELQLRNPGFPDVPFGILVHSVNWHSLGHRSGIHPGDVITHINKKEMRTPQDVRNQLATSGSLSIRIVRKTRTLDIKLDDS